MVECFGPDPNVHTTQFSSARPPVEATYTFDVDRHRGRKSTAQHAFLPQNSLTNKRIDRLGTVYSKPTCGNEQAGASTKIHQKHKSTNNKTIG